MIPVWLAIDSDPPVRNPRSVLWAVLDAGVQALQSGWVGVAVIALSVLAALCWPK